MWPITERVCSAKPRPVENVHRCLCARDWQRTAPTVVMPWAGGRAAETRCYYGETLMPINASENNRKAQWTNDNIRIEFIRRNRWDRSVNVTCQTGVLWQVCVSGVHRPHAHIHTLYRFSTQWQMICFVVFSSIKRPWMVVIIWWSV